MLDTQRANFGSVPAPAVLVAHSLVLISLTIFSACTTGSAGNKEAIDQDVFIQTYVDLRISALRTDSQRLAVTDREEILASHSVTAVELTHFARLHADDVVFMREVWNEVERRMDVHPSENR